MTTTTTGKGIEITDAIRALTPGANEWDLAAMIAHREAMARDDKFQPAMFLNDGGVGLGIATCFARAYSGSFGFMVDMKHQARRYGLNPRQVAGVLNCWWREVIDAVKKAREAAARDDIFDLPVGAKADLNRAADAILARDAEQPVIASGYYTIVRPDGHLTLRINDAKNHPGTQKIAALTGPANEHDYQPFGFLKGARFVPFSAFRQGYADWQEGARYLLSSDEQKREQAGILYAAKSGNCRKCGRLLTDPTSIALGIGPECAKRGL